MHRERGADSSLADAAGAEADDEFLRAQVERLASRRVHGFIGQLR